MATILPFKSRGTRPLLREAFETRQLVRLWREELEFGSYCGYIGAMGQVFLAMWVLGDNLGYDGIHILRQRDVTDIELPDKHHAFLEQAIALGGFKPEVPGGLQLDEVRAMVASVAALAPVFSVRVDNDNPDEADVCYVGRLVAEEDDGFLLQEITPEAHWLREPSFFAWDEVSSLCFDDPYASILARVAGPAPKLDTTDTGHGRLN